MMLLGLGCVMGRNYAIFDTGIGRCGIVLEPKVVPVDPRPFRAFQGWRYLTVKDAPPDLDKAGRGTGAAMPEKLRRELRDLGLM